MFNPLSSLSGIFSNKDLKPSSRIVKGKAQYLFECGIDATQEQLNLDQDEKLVEILADFDLSLLSDENFSVKDFVSRLITQKIIKNILHTILISSLTLSPDDFGKLKNEEIENVFEDFFFLNPKAIEWLSNIANVLTSYAKIRTLEDSKNQSE